MRTWSNKAKSVVLVALFLVLIIGSTTILIYQMNQLIEDNMMNTIDELSEHDLTTIQNYLERNWNDLTSIYKRMVVYDCTSIHDAQERLSLERNTSDFYTLYLVAEDGTVYSDRFLSYSPEEMDIAQHLEEEGAEHIAKRYDFKTTTEAQREMLLYAVRLENFELDGIRFVALAGLSNINQIQNRITIFSFYKNGESRGYSSVVNWDGDFIVNIRRTVSLNNQENLYKILSSGITEGDWSEAVIREKMEAQERFFFHYEDSNDVDSLYYFIPVPATGVKWYFVMMVEETVFTEMSQRFIFSSVLMVAIALIISVTTLLLLSHSNRETITARAEAKARNEFLSNMSHEIRTPLNGIIGLNHLMRAHLFDADGQQMMDWLNKANDTAQYLLSLVSDILDISKLQAGKLELNEAPFLLDAVIDNIESMQRSNAENRGIELTVRKSFTAPCVVGDVIRLKQVLMNIVGNAVKFTPQGGRIYLSASQGEVEEDRVTTTFICADTGIGMSQEFLEHIWDSFSQASGQVTNGAQGTGLGMAISKQIVDIMGGTITVESQLGEGSVFTVAVRMPVADPAQVITASIEEAPACSETERPAAEARPVKLLVAEDNELNAEILQEILTDAGFEVVLAENGQLAVEEFSRSREGEYDAILMDMQMPVMDGCEATRIIRSMRRTDADSITILACTANSFQEDKDRALESGMDDFITKPIDIGILLGKLKQYGHRGDEEQ